MSRVLSAGRPSAKKKTATTLADVTEAIEYKRVNFDLAAEDHAKLKVYAAKQNLTIRELLTDYVKSLPD